MEISESFAVFQRLQYGDLHIHSDLASGLIAIIAIHSTKLGPALGGCRYIEYGTFDEAVVDALRLAKAMSFKSAITDLPFGGGKAVIIKSYPMPEREHFFQAFGKFVHSLQGQYITAEDSGTTVADMDIIKTVTPFVTGINDPNFSFADPSILTAIGIRYGMQAAVKFALKRDNLEGLHVAIQGVGKVGYQLVKELIKHGVKITVSDLNAKNITKCQEEFKVEITAPEHIHKIACDIFAPCALSNAIHPGNLNEIQAKIIAGSANNQLKTPDLADVLMNKGILYAPDYVINAGGLIHAATQYLHEKEQSALEKAKKIENTLTLLFERSITEQISPLEIANRIARERLLVTRTS